MSTSRLLFCILLLSGALGLAASPTQGRLRCYACSFAKPCQAVPTECRDDEVCGISVGTSDLNETIERRGCLPRAQCALPGRATRRLRPYALRHRCCERDLCNAASRLPSARLATRLLLAASFSWGGHLLR